MDLVAENTRRVVKKGRLSRFRHRESESPAASSSKRRNVIDSSDDDLDNDERPRVVDDISKIFDDDRRGEDEDEDMDDFIEFSDEEAEVMNEDAREVRREEKRRQQIRRKRAVVRPELAGIDAKWVAHRFAVHVHKVHNHVLVPGTKFTRFLVTDMTMTGRLREMMNQKLRSISINQR